MTTTRAEEAQRLGANLRQIRELMEMTQEEVAEKLDIDPVTYSRYETGARTCPLRFVRGMSKLSGISFQDFFASEGELTGGLLPGLAGYLEGLSMPAQMALLEFFEASVAPNREYRERLAKSREGLPMFGHLRMLQKDLKELGMDFELLKDPEQGWLLWPAQLVVDQSEEDEADMEDTDPSLFLPKADD